MDMSCVTDVTADVTADRPNHEQPPLPLDQLYKAIWDRGQAIVRNIDTIARGVTNNYTNPLTPDFTKPDYGFNFVYNTRQAICHLHPAPLVRLSSHWTLGMHLENRPKEEQLPNFKRQSILEFSRVTNNTIANSLTMHLRQRTEEGQTPVIRHDATTLIQFRRGDANPSSWFPTPIAENPAIVQSLDKAAHFFMQADDAITPSNLAILLLPLTLNLIPNAVIVDVPDLNFGLFVYIILTDLLTVIPLTIKGTELLRIQAFRFRSVVVRISSPLNVATLEQSAVGEIWAAECRARENVFRMGLILVILSAVFALLGVALEFIARSYVLRNRLHYHLKHTADMDLEERYLMEFG